MNTTILRITIDGVPCDLEAGPWVTPRHGQVNGADVALCALEGGNVLQRTTFRRAGLEPCYVALLINPARGMDIDLHDCSPHGVDVLSEHVCDVEDVGDDAS